MIALIAAGTIVALAFAYCQVLIIRRYSEDRLRLEQTWARERSELLNRIKPETAQPVLGEPAYPSPRGVVPDDDAAFWAARGLDVSEVR